MLKLRGFGFVSISSSPLKIELITLLVYSKNKQKSIIKVYFFTVYNIFITEGLYELYMGIYDCYILYIFVF